LSLTQIARGLRAGYDRDMMTATHNSTADEQPRGRAQPSLAGTGGSQEKPKTSATERWVLISKNVYSRAQRRAFVGGDPFEDVAEAIKDIDDEYVTDLGGLLSLTDPAELVEQFRNLFAGFGLEKRSLDELLDMHRDALEKLAESNRALINGAAERTVSRVALLSKATEDAMDALRSMARTAARIKAHAFLPGQPTESAFRNVLSRLSALANSVGKFVENGRGPRNEATPGTQRRMEIHGGVVKAYDGMTPAELAQAPIAALKGISNATGERLTAAFGMASIRDMASSDLFQQAQGIVTLADAEQTGAPGGAGDTGPLTELAQGSVLELAGMTSRQAEVLRASFRIETVKDLAQNKFFRLARAIVVMADHDS